MCSRVGHGFEIYIEPIAWPCVTVRVCVWEKGEREGQAEAGIAWRAAAMAESPSKGEKGLCL